ncbi:MAG TPA: insulinase family protein [Flavobacteriaceae bacterium]|nr:insulinase family protein [Flavobacteriaceae bacterium]
MRKYLYLFLAGFLISNIVVAQIDRSKQPAPGPAPKVNLTEPQSFKLDNGLTVLVVENHKLPTVRMQLLIDNPMYAAGNKAGVESLFAALMGNGTKNISKDAFNEEVDYMGATLAFGNDHAYALGLSEFTPRLIELLSDAIKNPLFTQEEFESEKSKLIESLKMGEKSVAEVANRVRDALVFGSNHPKGEFTTIEKVENLKLSDVISYYENFFNPNNAYLAVVGDVKRADIQRLFSQHLSDWKRKSVPAVKYSTPKDVQYTQVNFVDMPNAVQSQIAVMNLVDLKMSHPDYFPLLIANRILGGGGLNSYLNMNLREKNAWTYGAYSTFSADKEISSFMAYTEVRNAVTDSAVVEILKEIQNIRNNKITVAQLNNAKAKYTGDFVVALERPETIATYALRIKTQNLPDDFYFNYLKKINAVTPDDVARVAKKYFKPDNFRIVVVGKGSEVLEGLKNLRGPKGKIIPVMYFDKFANPSTEPVFNQPVSGGVTAEMVIEKYLDAVGGRKTVENINSIKIDGTLSMQGMNLNVMRLNTKRGQSITEVSMGSMTLQKMVFDGEKGYQIQQGQRMENSAEENEEAKLEATPFPILSAKNPQLLREEDVDGRPAYVLSFKSGTENFYDKETGLLVKQESVVEVMGQTFSSTTILSDYREVDGLKIPFVMEEQVGPQSMKVTVDNVEINGKVSDDMFK